MIQRIYIKNLLSFKEIELNFDRSNRLIVFSGPSGAGKSVLLNSILSLFGYKDLNPELSEAILDNDIDLTDIGILVEDEIIIKQIQKNKSRYFINNQTISKKALKNKLSSIVKYLSVRNIEELSQKNLIGTIDNMIKNKKFLELKKEFEKDYSYLEKLKNKLSQINNQENNIKEKKEFLEYEIEKIESINPQPKEFDKLMETKKNLSKIDKIEEKLKEVKNILFFENIVFEFLELIEEDTTLFENCMNELKLAFETASDKINQINEIDVEEILNRLSQLNYLVNRFNSIENALNYLEEKKKELNALNNIEFEKINLEKEIDLVSKRVLDLAHQISYYRKEKIKEFEEKLNFFLEKLYMPQSSIKIKHIDLNKYGIDYIDLKILNTNVKSISTGEINRLRVALLASNLEYDQEEKILFLDEIDSNLSGEESMSIAKVLKYLSTKYQIFAISHQPQLTSQANTHILVKKENQISYAKILTYEERIEEIARIIGSSNNSEKAKEYAKELLGYRNDS